MRIDVENIEKIKIDEKDRKILYILSKDSRKTYNEIAKEVLLSPDTVSYRVDRLIRNGVIIKFIPDVAFRQFGFYKYSVFMQLIELSQEKEKAFINDLQKNPNVISVMQYTDKFDMEIVMVARGINDFDEILNKLVNKHTDIIDDVSTFQQVVSYKSAFLPDNFSKLKKDIKVPRKKPKGNVRIDEKDIKLLSLLNKNSRESSYILADKMGTSVDTVLYRIKKLEEHDVIHRFTTVINLSRLGFNWYTFLVNLTSITKDRESELKEFVRKHNNILRCVRGIGEWTLVFYMIAPSQPEFHKAVNELRTRFRDIIKNYDTLLSYKEHKFEEYERCLGN